MISARVRKTGSSLPWYFSMIAFTDSASIRACAGSYTPHGRSQCAYAVTTGCNKRMVDLLLASSRTLPRGPYSQRGEEHGHCVGRFVAVAARPGQRSVDGADAPRR